MSEAREASRSNGEVRVRFAGREVPVPPGGATDLCAPARDDVVGEWGEGGTRSTSFRVPADEGPLAGLHECGQAQCGAGRVRNPRAREAFCDLLVREFEGGARGSGGVSKGGWNYASLGSGGLLGDWRVLEALRREGGYPETICLVDAVYKLPSPGMEDVLSRFSAWFGVPLRCFWNVDDYADACRRDPGLLCDVLCMQDAPVLRILVDGDGDLPHGGHLFPAKVLRDGGLFAWVHPHGDNAAADVGAKRFVQGDLVRVHQETCPC